MSELCKNACRWRHYAGKPKKYPLEELQKNYPIGKVLSWRKPVRMVGYYMNQVDLDYFYKNYKDVDILSDYEVAYTLPSTPLEIVEGYLFDGKHWFAMKETWDGWISIE